jgi:hypothetical protein
VNTLKQIYLELEREIQSIGLGVKERKAKYLIVSTSEVRRRPKNLLVGEKILKVSLVSLIWEP